MVSSSLFSPGLPGWPSPAHPPAPASPGSAGRWLPFSPGSPGQLLQPSSPSPPISWAKALVFLLIVPDEGPALVLVSGQIPAQASSSSRLLAGLLLCLQGGQTGVELGQLLSDFQRALLKIGLALSLTLRLAFQGGGPPPAPGCGPGALGVRLDLGRALSAAPALPAGTPAAAPGRPPRCGRACSPSAFRMASSHSRSWPGRSPSHRRRPPLPGPPLPAPGLPGPAAPPAPGAARSAAPARWPG